MRRPARPARCEPCNSAASSLIDVRRLAFQAKQQYATIVKQQGRLRTRQCTRCNENTYVGDFRLEHQRERYTTPAKHALAFPQLVQPFDEQLGGDVERQIANNLQLIVCKHGTKQHYSREEKTVHFCQMRTASRKKLYKKPIFLSQLSLAGKSGKSVASSMCNMSPNVTASRSLATEFCSTCSSGAKRRSFSTPMTRRQFALSRLCVRPPGPGRVRAPQSRSAPTTRQKQNKKNTRADFNYSCLFQIARQTLHNAIWRARKRTSDKAQWRF